MELWSEEQIEGHINTQLAGEEWVTNLTQILRIGEIFTKMGEEPLEEELVAVEEQLEVEHLSAEEECGLQEQWAEGLPAVEVPTGLQCLQLG